MGSVYNQGILEVSLPMCKVENFSKEKIQVNDDRYKFKIKNASSYAYV